MVKRGSEKVCATDSEFRAQGFDTRNEVTEDGHTISASWWKIRFARLPGSFSKLLLYENNIRFCFLRAKRHIRGHQRVGDSPDTTTRLLEA